jgi:excisionase family DNA binding protein
VAVRFDQPATAVAKQQPSTLADQIERIGRALTANELADILNVSKITIFKQAKAGRIPCFRIGTCVRFDPRAIANWLRAQ